MKIMPQKPADRAKKPAKKNRLIRLGLTTEQENYLKKQVAQLYGRGHARRKIVAAYWEKITPHLKGQNPEQRKAIARRMLIEWEREETFRDMVWEEAVGKLDMDSPHILEAVASKAKRGRVDAAKLALSVSGRHQPLEQQASHTNVQVVFANPIPRPAVTSPPPIALSRQVKAIVRQAEAIPDADED